MKKQKEVVINTERLSLNARVCLEFDVEHTFSYEDVQHDPEGDERDFEPTHQALQEFAEELKEHLVQAYRVNNVHVVDCETLICVNADSLESGELETI